MVRVATRAQPPPEQPSNADGDSQFVQTARLVLMHLPGAVHKHQSCGLNKLILRSNLTMAKYTNKLELKVMYLQVRQCVDPAAADASQGPHAVLLLAALDLPAPSA